MDDEVAVVEQDPLSLGPALGAQRSDPGLPCQLGLDLFGDGVAAVEWAERLPPELSSEATRLRFEVARPDGRTVTVSTSEERIAQAASTA